MLFQFTDGNKNRFYFLIPFASEFDFELRGKTLTAIRDAIVLQREAWNGLLPAQRRQIEKDLTSRISPNEIPDSARPYQDFLRNRELEQVFQKTSKPSR